MSVRDPHQRNSIGFHPRVSDAEVRKREAALRVAEHHLTAAEFNALMADMADGKVDVRIYDDAIVLMRQG